MIDNNILDKLTISGFRGILNTELTDEVIKDLVRAFVLNIKNTNNGKKLKILIGRDGRESGQQIEQVIVQTLINCNVDVTVGGLLTTPSILYLTKNILFDGALIITASHNPIEYNGLKFVTSDGFFASKELIQKMKESIKNNSFEEINNTEKGEANYDNSLANIYIGHIATCFTKLKSKTRVIVDPVNSSGSIMAPEFLRTLGCDVITIHDEPIGVFARSPEPNPLALEELGKRTLGYNMDVGFGLDPDADRLVIVDEKGIPVFEEYTLALCAQAFYLKLQKENALEKAGPCIINLSTSNTTLDVAKSFNIKTIHSSVGEPNVVKKMIQENSMFGGEGNGGVIFRPVNFCRDSFVGMALILYLMEETGKTISELVAELPKYIMLKEKINNVANFHNYIPSLIALFPTASVNDIDGVRFDFPDNSWVQVRASNTEPIVRIYGEAKDNETLAIISSQIKSVLSI